MKQRLILVAALTLALPATAAEFTSLNTLAQAEFHRVSQDLGAAFSYKGVTPATPLGLAGFDIGVEVSTTRIENSSLFRLAGAGAPGNLVVPKVHVHKGLWGGLDIGAFLAGTSQVDATVYGAEVRYAVVDDGITTPAVGLRLSGSRATGTGALRLSTLSADVVVSKRFVLLTPYAGAGTVRVQSSVQGSALAEERFNKGRYFAGVNLNLVAANIAFEAEKMGENTSLSAKLGFRF